MPMNDQMYDDFHLEKLVRAQFGVSLEVDTVIARNLPVSRTDVATLFLSDKKQLYLYIQGQSKLLLDDVKKIVSRVGLKAELYLPPKGRPQYFEEIAAAKFRMVFPGRGNVTSEDLAFYKTLAPYNPALVMINEVKNGQIYQFDADSHGGWRVKTKFAYRRIKTS